MHWPYGYPYGGGWWIMVIMIVFWLVLLGLGAWLAVWLVKQTRTTPPGGQGSPLDILNRRYASGEISKEEYERMKRDISET